MNTQLLYAAAASACGFVAGIFGGWVRPPEHLPQSVIRVLTVLLGVATAVLGTLAVAAAGGPVQPPPPSGSNQPAADPNHVLDGTDAPGQLPPALANDLLLSIDSGAGSPTLYSWHIDGSNRQLLGGTGSTVTPIQRPGTTNIISPLSPAGASTFAIYEVSLAGDPIRRLTSPPDSSFSDEDVALAASSGQVFVARTRAKIIDSSTGTLTPYELFEFPLSRPSATRRLAFASDLQEITVDAAGHKLAGQCAGAAGRPAQICVIDLQSGRRSAVPGAEDTTMSDAALSPDGNLLAYDAYKPNPYGKSQVFVYNLITHVTVEVSRLEGQNDQPVWAPGSISCLAFHHDETSRETVHIACASSSTVWSDYDTKAIGSNPAWFVPPR